VVGRLERADAYNMRSVNRSHVRPGRCLDANRRPFFPRMNSGAGLVAQTDGRG